MKLHWKVLAIGLIIIPAITDGFLDRAAKKITSAVGGTVGKAVSKITGQDRKSRSICYRRVGCLSLDYPWSLRPFPVPVDPDTISASVKLFTRTDEDGFQHILNVDNFDLEESDYDINRPATVIITHGFASNGESDWLHDMKDAYLQNVDANIFILDWGKGASSVNYLQVASNTRVVGAQLSRFVRYLIELGDSPKKMHLIGHSLGSHIMSYAAKNVSDLGKIRRITALDPAQPGFEGFPSRVRLDTKDAENIDVIHTDAKPTIPFLGFGMLSPVGTADFYCNGGSMQPGCLDLPTPNITSLTDLGKYPVEVISKWVACSHGRAYEYFTASLLAKNCSFWGRKMSYTEGFLKVGTLGRIALADPIVDALTSCTEESCNSIGMHTFDLPARGIFSVTTKSEPPYCETSEEETKYLTNLLTLGLSEHIPNIANIGKGLVRKVLRV